jgi:hypothetical protein
MSDVTIIGALQIVDRNLVKVRLISLNLFIDASVDCIT